MQIIILTYNRVKSLERLVGSLLTSLGEHSADLLLSLECDSDKATKEFASNLNWPFGQKKILQHDTHLGLDRHVLACLKEAENYSFSLILEDDMFLVPGFMDFAKAAAKRIERDEDCVAASLYRYERMEGTDLPFIPLNTGTGAYLHQKVSSRGLLITGSAARKFGQWLEGYDTISQNIPSPSYLTKWTDSAWETMFTKYLISQNLYLLYPGKSFITAFAEPGVHFSSENQIYLSQTPLTFLLGEETTELENAQLPAYDAWYEIKPEFLNSYVKELAEYNYTVDIYGTKSPRTIKTDYVLTCKKSSAEAILGYKMELKPPENNILHNQTGNDVHLVPTNSLMKESRMELWGRNYYQQLYFNSKHSLVTSIKNRLFKMFGRK